MLLFDAGDALFVAQQVDGGGRHDLRCLDQCVVRHFAVAGLRERSSVRHGTFRVDGQGEGDVGDGLADVAAVSRRERLRVVRGRFDSDSRHVVDDDFAEAVQHEAVGVGGFVVDFEFAAGHQGRTAGAVMHALTEGEHIFDMQGPRHHFDVRVLGRHVRGRTAVRDDPTDAGIWRDVLPQGVHAGKGEHGGVAGIDAFVGAGAGVGGLAVERVGEAGRCDVRVADDDAVRAVPHDGHVDRVERSPFQQENLAAAAFFEGAAHDVDVAADFFRQYPAQGDAGSSGDRADEVVAAGVPEFGQGVVLGQQGDTGAGIVTAFDGAAEGDVDVGDAFFDVHAVLLHVVGQFFGGPVCFPAEFGVRVDV